MMRRLGCVRIGMVVLAYRVDHWGVLTDEVWRWGSSVHGHRRHTIWTRSNGGYGRVVHPRRALNRLQLGVHILIYCVLNIWSRDMVWIVHGGWKWGRLGETIVTEARVERHAIGSTF